jgi:hypothetical protein
MFSYHRNERPSSRPANEETSDSDDDLYKTKHKLPVQSYRSNSTHRSIVNQSPSFNRRSDMYQTSHPPPSKDCILYRHPDPDPSDSDDDHDRQREKEDSSDDYIVNTRIQKIDTSIIGVLDPDKGAINQYCENLRHLVTLFSEKSVVASIPSFFTGRAKDWFASHSIDPKNMRRVESWIEELEAVFKINTAAAGAEAKDRKYNSTDSDVMKYYYDKSGLLHTANEEISRQGLIGEIWLGLPADFRMSLQFSEVSSLNLSDFSHVLRDVDVTYREKRREEHHAKERNRDGIEGYHHIQDRDRNKNRETRTMDISNQILLLQGMTIARANAETKKIERKERRKGHPEMYLSQNL